MTELIWLDKNKDLYSYMQKRGIENPLNATEDEIKNTFLSLIKNYKDDNTTASEFVDIVFPLWSAPNPEDSEVISEIKDLLTDAEDISFNLPTHPDDEFSVMKPFLDFYDKYSS